MVRACSPGANWPPSLRLRVFARSEIFGADSRDVEMKFRGGCWLVLLLSLGVAAAWGQTNASPSEGWVTLGETKAEVIRRMGFPIGVAIADNREVLNYPAGQVVLENGRVVKVIADVRARPGATSAKAPQPTPRPTTPAVPAPRTLPTTPARVDAGKAPVVQSPRPAPVVVAPIQPAPRITPGPSFVWVLLGGPLVMFLIVVVSLVAVAALLVARQNRREAAEHARMLSGRSRAPGILAGPATLGETRGADGSLPGDSAAITTAMIDALEWKRFEELVAGYFQHEGYRAEETPFGPDGGVDVVLYRDPDPKPQALVQCKAWISGRVGVKPVRELLGVMAARKVERGFFAATCDFTPEAAEFVRGTGLTLLNGSELHERLQYLSPAARAELRLRVWRDDFQTPTCPTCGIKMVRREGASPFWGCRNFPRCNSTIPMRAEHR